MNGADSYFWHEDPLPVPERITRMLFIGIDPGVAGGIAIVNDDGSVTATHKMPETGRDIIDILKAYNTAPACPVRAVIEKVNPGVFGHGKVGKMGVVSAFTFGRNVERCHMGLIAAGIPFDDVLPVKWQTALGCRTRGDKNISKARAQHLFPNVKVTHAIADALLLAEYCRRAERGSLTSTPEPKGLFDGKEDRKEKGAGEKADWRKTRDAIREGLDRGLTEAVKGRRGKGAARRADSPASAAGAVARG